MRMKYFVYVIYFVILALIGAFIAINSLLGFQIYLVVAVIFTIALYLMLHFRKPIAHKAISQAVKMAAKQAQRNDSTEEDDPSISVQYDSEGVRGIQVNYNANAPGQPGAGVYNPAETINRTLELDLATQIAQIMNSDAPEAAKKQALNVLELSINNRNQGTSSSRKKTIRKRARLSSDQHPYGIQGEGKYSIE